MDAAPQVSAGEVTDHSLPAIIICVARAKIGWDVEVRLKLNRLTEFASSLHAPTSATLSGRRLSLARVAWLAIFVLTIGILFASIPAYYDWLINFADPELEPTTVRANLEAAGISVAFYATYLLLINTASALLWCAVGAIIFWRRSDEGMALFTSLGLVLFGVFFLSSDGPAALVKQYSALWLPVHLLAFFGSVSFYLFFYLFPDGRFVPRWLYWVPILWTAHETAYYFFPDSIFNIVRSFPLIDPVVTLTFLCIGIGAQLYRYRRVSGLTQRQQTKWVIFGMLAAGLGAVGFGLVINSSPILAEFGSPYAFVFETGILISMLLIPLSIGVAILHSRLWDVDIAINRALVYGSLTAALVALYLGGIVVLQRVFVALTGEKSPLAIVASTLLIAALFNPLRRRVQAFVDRRFYRSKYDARKTLEAFSAKLRDETDLNALRDDLVGVVRETMQPAHVSLWLRPDTPPKGEHAD